VPPKYRIGMAFCAAIATAVILGACGSGIPGNAVVQIGQATISTAALNHWLDVANDSSQTQTGTKAPPLPLPPDFAACVKDQQKTAGNTAASKSKSQVAIYKQTCQSNYSTLVTEVLNFLIPQMWIQGEAAVRGFKVTDKQVEKAYQQAIKSASPPLSTPKELNAFLAASGETVADLKWRTRVNLLGSKIAAAVQKQAGKVTEAQIAAYYKKNHAQYTTPETRDIHLVLVKSAADAAKVMALLGGGQSYATVASKYSLDPASKAKGGEMLGVSGSGLPPQASAKVFAAKTGVLTGPVKTAFGYYVFTVDTVHASQVEPFSKAKASIKAQLSQQQISAAQTKLQSDLTKKWTPQTTCRSGYTVQLCSNNPKGSTTASGVTGG
jgi:foldase protein PrsA